MYFLLHPEPVVFCYLAARCLSVAPKSLELWQNFLPKCRSLQLHQSREDSMDRRFGSNLKRSTDPAFLSNIFSSIFSRFFIDQTTDLNKLPSSAELWRIPWPWPPWSSLATHRGRAPHRSWRPCCCGFASRRCKLNHAMFGWQLLLLCLVFKWW